MTPRVNVVRLPFYAGLLTVVTFALILFPKFTIDDAFITFRYARNLAQFGQLTWNVGAPPVEGYTGVFLPVILALLMKLGVEPVMVSKVIGITAFTTGGLIANSLLRELGVVFRLRILVLCLYFFAPFYYVHSLSGLETMPFLAVFVGCFRYLYRYFARSSAQFVGDSVRLAATMLLLALIRPEGYALAAVFICGVLFWNQVNGTQGNRSFLTVILWGFMVPTVLYLSWKYSYYGQLLPLPYYEKRYTGTELINMATLGSFAWFFILYGFIPTMASFSVALIGRPVNFGKAGDSRPLCRNPFAFAWLCTICFLVIVLIQYFHSNLQMNFSFRFWTPFYAILLITVAVLWQNCLDAVGTFTVRTGSGWRGRASDALLSSFTVVQCALFLFVFVKEAHCYSVYKQFIDQCARPAASLLKKYVPEKEWLVVHIDAGAVPYYCGFKTVDFGGLNDKMLALGHYSDGELLNYFFSHNPAALVLTSYQWDTLDLRSPLPITSDPRFHKYRLVKVFRSEAGGQTAYSYRHFRFIDLRYCYFVYIRKDLLPATSLLSTSLRIAQPYGLTRLKANQY